jgi:prephenate dehydrogenase
MTLKIALVGLGRIGGSIGLGLKGTQGRFEIVGHDKDSEAAKRALKRGAVDRTDWNLISACDGVDLVVLSIPLAGIRDTLVALAQELKPGCVVTDTASLKVPVMNWARETLPESVHFVGGHPIIVQAGAESGESTADLLAGATYCLVPGTKTPQEAVQTVSNLAEALGARPFFVDAAEHDGLVAAMEHAPLILALGLQAMAGSSPSHRELAQLSGVHFAGVTQLLAGDAERLTDLCILNAENLARWLDVLQADLGRFREFVAVQDRESLLKSFVAAQAMRDRWNAAAGPAEGPAVDYSDFSMMRMLMGDTFRRRRREGE